MMEEIKMETFVIIVIILLGLGCVGLVGYILFRPVVGKEDFSPMAPSTPDTQDEPDAEDEGDAEEDLPEDKPEDEAEVEQDDIPAESASETTPAESEE